LPLYAISHITTLAADYYAIDAELLIVLIDIVTPLAE